MCTEAKEAELKDWAIGLVNILYTGSWYGLVVMLVSALLALACGMFRFNDWPYGVAASVCVAVFALLILGGLAAITVASGVSQSQMLDSVSSGCCQGAMCRGIACEGLHDPVPQQLLPGRDLRWSTSCLEVKPYGIATKCPPDRGITVSAACLFGFQPLPWHAGKHGQAPLNPSLQQQEDEALQATLVPQACHRGGRLRAHWHARG